MGNTTVPILRSGKVISRGRGSIAPQEKKSEKMKFVDIGVTDTVIDHVKGHNFHRLQALR